MRCENSKSCIRVLFPIPPHVDNLGPITHHEKPLWHLVSKQQLVLSLAQSNLMCEMHETGGFKIQTTDIIMNLLYEDNNYYSSSPN